VKVWFNKNTYGSGVIDPYYRGKLEEIKKGGEKGKNGKR
jgi:hypothetical protein